MHETFKQLSELLEHEQAPLALAQRCSGVAAPAPLFTSLFNYRHSDPGAMTSWPGIELLQTEERTNYPITVSVDDLGEEFALIVQCVEGISAARVGGYLLTAIDSVVDALMHAPERQATALAVLPAAERAQVTAAAVSGFEAYPIHVPFEEQAAVQPDAVAVVFDDRSLTYAELNRRANRVAHRLIALGVQPDMRVAICLERGLDLIVGLLGILKAGGAYVPLDPGYPTERVAYMLDDSAPVAVVTQQSLCDRLPGGERPTLVLDDAATMAALAEGCSDNPGWRALGLTPAHLAYVIYTSGSTGRPKGVMVEHAQVSRLFAATQEEFHFDDTDVWTLFHSYAFDFSVWEIFGALLHGGRLVVVPSLCARSPQEF